MAEELSIAKNGTKEEIYQSLVPQIAALTEGEDDSIANLANISAALKATFGWLWVGFYLVKGDELVLGPFQGPIACTRISKGKGVCGTCWESGKVMIVPDVDAFPGHIACSSDSRSEIVLPLRSHKDIVGVLDIDSSSLNEFDETDAHYLEQIINLVKL